MTDMLILTFLLLLLPAPSLGLTKLGVQTRPATNGLNNGLGLYPETLCFYSTTTPQVSETCHNITRNEQFRLSGAGVPSILGIGPGKTSSTLLASVLQKHPNIELGDAKRGGRQCCLMELYVLSRSPDFITGPKAYEKYFNMRKDAVYFEKTPAYANDRMAPYRALAMLGQKDLRLVYTFREPVEALYSLYKHRAYKNISFNTYAEMMMLSQAHLDECRSRIVQSQIAPPLHSASVSSASLSSSQVLASLSLQSRVFMEQMVELKCTPELKMGDALTQFDHAGNLRHWRSVFPSATIVCVNFTVWHRTGPGEADAVVQTLYEHLGLPASPAAVKEAGTYINEQKHLVHAPPGSSVVGSSAMRERIAHYYASSNSFTSLCDNIL